MLKNFQVVFHVEHYDIHRQVLWEMAGLLLSEPVDEAVGKADGVLHLGAETGAEIVAGKAQGEVRAHVVLADYSAADGVRGGVLIEHVFARILIVRNRAEPVGIAGEVAESDAAEDTC